ncbi:MAG: permease-like cell division protein FtsX [Patescibacteria group bacterium]|nr:permease-like cell division protein FtsX [Patescibacteria group bacterium]
MSKKPKVNPLTAAWHNLRRSPFQSFAAVTIMWLNFLVATSLVVLFFVFNSLLGYLESRPEVTAFLKDQTSQTEINRFKEQLESLDGVKEVRLVSKEDALKIYREQNKDNPLLLEMVNASILPASLEVSATSSDYLVGIADILKNETDLIEEVIFREDVVKNIGFWVKTVRNGGLVLVGLLSFVSLVVIMVIIGMKISAHREEINALRSLGATSFYIQKPFLFEGIFYGLMGAIFGFGIVFGAYFYWQEEIRNFLDPIPVLSISDRIIPIIFSIELVSGLFLGLTAAWLATRRFLKK